MTSLRLAWRELRGGVRDFKLFLGCLIVGVTVIAAVGLLSERVQGGIREEARALLGGDAELTLTNTRLDAEQQAFLRGYGRVSASVTLRAMAGNGQSSTLVELKGVEADYPPVGRLELASRAPLSSALGQNRVVVGEDLYDRLAVKPGDSLKLGNAAFTVADVILREPDRIAGAFSLGPRVIALQSGLEAAGLVSPGSLVRYHYTLLLSDPGRLAEFKRDLAERFPHAPWILKTYDESNRTVQSVVEKLQFFLTLAGLSSLLIGGVGILNAAEAYVAAKSTTIAIFKTLGARRGAVLAVYALVLGIVTLLGIFLSGALGWLLSLGLTPFLARYFPVSASAAHDWKPILLAAAFGALTVATFALLPLSRGVEVKPSLLFRALGRARGEKPARGMLALNLLLVAALIALIVLTSGDRAVASGFILAALACFALFTGAAWVLGHLARRLRLPPGKWRLGLSGLHRPGAPVFSIMLSIGIGLSVLVALLLVQENLEREIGEAIPAQAPSLFLIDIQPAQLPELGRFLADKPYVSQVESQPMVRGRIAGINGVPVERAAIGEEAKWATESDRGFTYAARQPDGTRLVQGSWWTADYRGAPLVSLDRKLAQGMNLKVGEKITVNILGSDLEAQIASLREVNYMTMRMNFALIFSPGAIERFPASDIMTLHVSGGERLSALVHELAQRFPSVSSIRVDESLKTFGEIISHISTAIRITALFTLVSGLMVLSSALAANLRERAYDTVVFKICGARRADILAVFLVEWLIIAAATAVVSCLFGIAGAWAILQRIGWVDFVIFPQALGEAVFATMLCVTGVGLMLQSRGFSLKTSAVLRNE